MSDTTHADREALQLVLQQAEDEGLWFKAETTAEAYLQQELRRLHAAIEADRLASQVDTGTAQAEAPGWQVERSNDLIQITSPHGGRWCLIRDDDKTKIGSFLFDYFAAQAKAGAPQPVGEPEIRRNEDGTLDEVVGTGDLHLEQMSWSHWWMALQYGEHRITVNFHSKRAIHASAEYEGQLASGSGSGSD